MPAAIATWPFGLPAIKKAGEILAAGQSAMDAVEHGINVTELDPDLHSVGYGGRPNTAGVVELDAAIMDGKNCDVGSVASVQKIKRPISLARKVMENNRHAMLVGPGAQEFALQQGFELEEMLTDEAKAKWELWKINNDSHSLDSHDTIGLIALDHNGDIVAGCSTSGLGYKMPGRVGDSPLIGSGLYADNEVGGAAATGEGEEMLKFCASFLTVEFMRQGATPKVACVKTIQRICEKRPQNISGDVNIIALGRNGEFGSATTRKEFPFAIWTPEICELRSIPKSL